MFTFYMLFRHLEKDCITLATSGLHQVGQTSPDINKYCEWC